MLLEWVWSWIQSGDLEIETVNNSEMSTWRWQWYESNMMITCVAECVWAILREDSLSLSFCDDQLSSHVLNTNKTTYTCPWGHQQGQHCYVWPSDQALNLNVAITCPRVSTYSCCSEFQLSPVIASVLVHGPDNYLSITTKGLRDNLVVIRLVTAWTKSMISDEISRGSRWTV